MGGSPHLLCLGRSAEQRQIGHGTTFGLAVMFIGPILVAIYLSVLVTIKLFGDGW